MTVGGSPRGTVGTAQKLLDRQTTFAVRPATMIPMRKIYVENGVGMAWDAGAAAWSFDIDLWGTCCQAPAEQEAVLAFDRFAGPTRVVELIGGDEMAFRRDHVPATDQELAQTLSILTAQRRRSLHALVDLPSEILDRDDPHRKMPAWARWRTIRESLWHIADTESRYYLPACGLPSRERHHDLRGELRDSAGHVRDVIMSMPRDLVYKEAGEVWTSTKLLRRLAWHEKGELDAIGQLLHRWKQCPW